MDIVLGICADIAEFVIELCLLRDEKKKKVKLKNKKES